MKIEILRILIPRAKVTTHFSSKEDPFDHKFSSWMDALRFVEDYITSNNMEIININTAGDEKWGYQILYHLQGA